MIYIVMALLILVGLYLSKRQVGLALLVMLVMAQISGLLLADLVQLVRSAGFGLSLDVLTIGLKCLLVLLPTLVVLWRAPNHKRGLIWLAGESALMAGLLILFLQPQLTNLVRPDELGWQVVKLVNSYAKWLVVGAGAYGLYGLFKKSDEG